VGRVDTYECTACGWRYIPGPDESGPDADGVVVIPFEELGDDWSCPECGAAAGQFVAIGHEDVYETWECGSCGWKYDPESADAEDDEVEFTPFEQLDNEWTCPHCGASKDRFSLPGEDDGEPDEVAEMEEGPF